MWESLFDQLLPVASSVCNNGPERVVVPSDSLSSCQTPRHGATQPLPRRCRTACLWLSASRTLTMPAGTPTHSCTHLLICASNCAHSHINQMLGPPLRCPSMHPGYLAAVPLRTAATTRLDWRFHCMVAHTHMHTHKESHKRATNSTGFIHPQLWCKLISGDGRLNQKVITFYGKIINKNCHNKQT